MAHWHEQFAPCGMKSLNLCLYGSVSRTNCWWEAGPTLAYMSMLLQNIYSVLKWSNNKIVVPYSADRTWESTCTLSHYFWHLEQNVNRLSFYAIHIVSHNPIFQSCHAVHWVNLGDILAQPEARICSSCIDCWSREWLTNLYMLTYYASFCSRDFRFHCTVVFLLLILHSPLLPDLPHPNLSGGQRDPAKPAWLPLEAQPWPALLVCLPPHGRLHHVPWWSASSVSWMLWAKVCACSICC